MAANDPDRLGRYAVARRLGNGGQGVVYEAYDDAGDRVAIKVLHRGTRGRDFVREVAAAQRVASFCTARLIAADASGPEPYLVSEYVEGPSLRQAVEDGGVFAGDRLHGLAIGIMTALVAIHEAGVAHRDLKPDNVLLSPDGPRVIDFGIARIEDMTPSTSVGGTPPYMSPEALRGEAVGPAADVFSWGAVMLFAATGHSPFMGATMAEILHRVLTLEPDCGVLPHGLRGVVERALAKWAEDRPSSRDLLITAGRAGRRAGCESGARRGGRRGRGVDQGLPAGGAEGRDTLVAAIAGGAGDQGRHGRVVRLPGGGQSRRFADRGGRLSECPGSGPAEGVGGGAGLGRSHGADGVRDRASGGGRLVAGVQPGRLPVGRLPSSGG
jgi:hypothetical protein